MKKRSAKSKSKRGDVCMRVEDGQSKEGKDGDDIESLASVHLGNVGVKVECEGIVDEPGGLLESVEQVVESVESPWEEIPPPDMSQPYVADLTSQFNRIFVQTTFDSFQEFERLFNKFKAETGSVFRIKSSCSTAYENSRRKKHFIPSRFKFVTVRYCCVHYGQPKAAGQGIRTKQRYLPCGCESMLSVSYNRGALVISQANMQHNHEVSSEMAPFYSINRRISNTELKEVAGAVELIPNSRALQHFLQIHFHRPTTLQDAKNVRTRLKALKALQAARTRSPSSKESGTPLFEDEEEEEEQDENVVMDCIDEGVDFSMQEDVERRAEKSESDYWEESIVLKGAKRQPYQEQDWVAVHVIGEQEEKKQESKLEPGMRREVLSEVRTRLYNVMENCSARVFQERVSVLERLIEGWENGDPVQIQYMEESDYEVGTFELMNGNSSSKTSLFQERTENQNLRNVNSCSSIDSLNIGLPVMRIKGESQFFPLEVSRNSVKVEHETEVKITSVMGETNGNSSVIRHNPGYGDASHHKTYTNRSLGMEKNKSNLRGPVIFPIMKEFAGGHDQAMEVLIEVDEDVAEVKAVRREPLDYYEVNVGE